MISPDRCITVASLFMRYRLRDCDEQTTDGLIHSPINQQYYYLKLCHFVKNLNIARMLTGKNQKDIVYTTTKQCVSDFYIPAQAGSGGAMRDRTADLLDANQALSQLSYGPILTGSFSV